VTFEQNAIVFSFDPSLETLNRLADGVAKIEGGASWWLGDIGLKIFELKSHEFRNASMATGMSAEERNALAAAHAWDYIRGRGTVIGYDGGYWEECIKLSRFFPMIDRSMGLTVKHHRAAMRGAGGSDAYQEKDAHRRAANWLFKAADKGWSAAELRRQINLALATHDEPSGDPESNAYELLDEADKFAMQHKDDTLSRDSAARLLTRWQALIDFVERLKAIASENQIPA
jgi:hypothetical protein